VNWSSQQQSVVARNAFIGAFLYLVTLCVSLFCWVRTARNSVSLRYVENFCMRFESSALFFADEKGFEF